MKKRTIAGSMNRIVRKSLVATMLLLLACNNQKKAMAQSEDAHLELIVSDANSGGEVSETLVIRNAKTLKSFYSKVNKTRKPGLPVPDIDFEKEMIVITCSGVRTDGSLPVLKFKEETDSKIMLETALRTVTVDAPGTTSPFSLYKMPLTDKEIVFEAHQ